MISTCNEMRDLNSAPSAPRNAETTAAIAQRLHLHHQNRRSNLALKAASSQQYQGLRVFGKVKVDLQALHRARDLIVSTRTRLICQMRAFCLEYGIAMRNGAGAFKLDFLKVLNDDTNELTP